MPDTYYIPQQIDGPENAVWVEYVARATKHADLPEHAIHGSQPAPSFSFETGETQTTEDGHEYPIVQSVPYGVMDDSGVRSPTAEEWAAWAPWEAAQAQAAQAALLQAIVDAAGDQIKTLEGIIDWFIVQGAPLTRPLSKDDVFGDVYAWLLAQPDAVLRDAGNSHATAMLALFSGLLDAGLDEAMINAVWKYMIATGQN